MSQTFANNSLAADAAAKRPVEKQVNYSIEGVKGLRLLAHPTGKRTWVVRYQIGHGKKRVERSFELGAFKHSKAAKEEEGLKLAEASSRAAEILRDAKQGIDPAAERQVHRDADTFSNLAEQWFDFKTREGRADAYVQGCRLRLAKLPAWFTCKKAMDLKRVDVTGCLEKTAKRGVTAETNRTQAFISAVLGWGLSEGILTENVAHGVNKRFKEETRDRVLSDNELTAIWKGIDTLKAEERTKLAIKLCIVLGQRPKEICELKLRRLVLDGPAPTATIEKGSAKNRTEHVVPLPRLAVELLQRAETITAEEHKKRNEKKAKLGTTTDDQPPEYVFPNRSGKKPLDPHVLSTALLRARDEKTGDLFSIADCELYDARKTLATFLGNSGHPDQFVGMLLNHLSAKSGVTGKHYNHATYMTQKRAMIEQWASHLDGVLGLAASSTNVVALVR